MNKSIAVGLVAGAAVALIGVALYKAVFVDEINCTKHKHHCVRVTIEPINASTAQVHVDVPKLRKTGKKHVIWWYIDNDPDAQQAYAFPDAGITFVSSEGQAEFLNSCNRQNDPSVFRCEDKEGKKAPADQPDGYKYTVTVISINSSTINVLPEDPFIYND